MRYTTALLSLAALAVAQDCVSNYETCLLTKDEPSCNSELASCKNVCGMFTKPVIVRFYNTDILQLRTSTTATRAMPVPLSARRTTTHA
jgi:hypothetical protein